MGVDPVHVFRLSNQSSDVPLTSRSGGGEGLGEKGGGGAVLRSAKVYRDPETISDLDIPRVQSNLGLESGAFLRRFFERSEANPKSDNSPSKLGRGISHVYTRC